MFEFLNFSIFENAILKNKKENRQTIN